MKQSKKGEQLTAGVGKGKNEMGSGSGAALGLKGAPAACASAFAMKKASVAACSAVKPCVAYLINWLGLKASSSGCTAGYCVDTVCEKLPWPVAFMRIEYSTEGKEEAVSDRPASRYGLPGLP